VLLLVAKAWSAVTSAFGASPDSDVADSLNTTTAANAASTTAAGSLKRLHSSSSSSKNLQHCSSSSRALLKANAAVAESSALMWEPPQPPLDCDSERTLSLTALRSVLTGSSVRLSSEEAAWVLARLGSSYDLSSINNATAATATATAAAAAAVTPRKGDRSTVNSPRSSSRRSVSPRSGRRANTTPRQRESVTTATGAAAAGATAAGAESDAMLAGTVTSNGNSGVSTVDGQQQQQPNTLLKQVTLADFFYAVFDVEAAAQVSHISCY
jgi:hypothetical protein